MANSDRKIYWKGFQLDYDQIMAADASSYLYCFTNRERLALLSIANVLHWKTRWKSDVGIVDEDAIGSLASKIEEILMANLRLRFRPDPNDPCRVEYSVDDGVTWELAWDAGACLSKSSGSIHITVSNYATYQTVINETTIVYDGDVTNIAPDWAYGGSGNAHRNNAMCYALRIYVDLICDTAIALNKKSIKDDLWGIANAISDALADAAAIFYTLGEIIGEYAAIPAVALALGKVGSEVLEIWLREDWESYDDSDAREEVLCYALERMINATPAFPTWEGMLGGFTGSANAEIIAEAVEASLHDEDVFMEYMLLMSSVIGVSEAGVDLMCPCLMDWYHAIDFTAGLGGFVVTHGAWSTGVGIESGNWDVDISGQSWATRGVTGYIDYEGSVKRCRITFNRTWGEWSYSLTSEYATIQDPQYLEFRERDGASEGSGLTLQVDAPYNVYERSAVMAISCQNTNGHYDGDVVMTKIEFWGSGENPFE